MRGARARLKRTGVALAVMALALLAAGCQPAAVTDEARDMNALYNVVLIAAIIVFALVTAGLVYAIVRYRRRDDALPPQFHGGGKIEALMVGVPVIIVIALFTVSMLTLVRVDDRAEPDDLTIEVTGFQFSWQFTYNLNDLGDGGADLGAEGAVSVIGTPANEPVLMMPVDEPVEFVLRSNDVIHSFYVRDFLYKLDLFPGRVNAFTVTARETGDYRAQCAELCGLNHALMRFTVRVVERDAFDAWIAGEAVRQLGEGARVRALAEAP